MKRINPIVALLIIICLASGLLLLQEDTPQAEGVHAETTLKNTHGSATVAEADTPPAVEQEMTFSVTGLNAKASSVYVAVFESEAGFPNSELSSNTRVISATEDQVRFSLALRQNQPFAIAVFQDIDGNGKLSKNGIGIPTEPYGFSNNARGLLGPPAFSQAVFTMSNHPDQAEPMEIRLR